MSIQQIRYKINTLKDIISNQTYFKTERKVKDKLKDELRY